MKRRLFTALLALAAALTLAVPAFADVMWEPYGNSFYESHREECGYEDRSYLANGPQGYVTLYRSPQSSAQVYNLPNQGELYVGYRWTAEDGTVWAVGDCSVTDAGGQRTWYTGWAPMDELALVYDHIAFEEEHGGQFQTYDGSGDELEEVCLYSYPGGVYQGRLTQSRDYMPFAEAFRSLYTDENGLRWTSVGYYMGHRDAWLCIDDPLNEALGSQRPLAVSEVQSEDPSNPAQTDVKALVPPAQSVPAARAIPLWAIPAALVVLAAAVTALLVRRNRRAK